MIIDMHTHAGRPNRIGPVDRSVLATMAQGGVAAAVVSAIADLPMIRRNRETKRLEKVRDPEPGECLAAVEDYLATFEATGMIRHLFRLIDTVGTDLPAGAAKTEMPDFSRHAQIAAA